MMIAVKGAALSTEETKIYSDYVKAKHPDKEITELVIEISRDSVILNYYYAGALQSESVRIKRIPGYSGENYE